MGIDDLPQVQRELLDYLTNRQQKGYPPPTLREIMAYFDLCQKPVESRLKALQAAGFITWQPGKSRTIRVLTPGQVWVAVPESRLPLVDAVIAKGDSIPGLVRALEAIAREQRLAGAKAEYNPSEVPL